MRRRDFLAVLGGAVAGWPLAVMAQTQSKVHRLGSISPAAPMPENSPFGAILLRELARRGYALGQNLTYETRGVMGQMNELPQIFQDLMAKNVDVIVGSGYPVALAAKTSGVPTVVAFGVGDPVATGLIDGLARPGGNITGISDDATALTTKRLGLLKEMAPNLRRVAMLWNNGDLAMRLRYEASAGVAKALGITVQPVGVREPKDFEAALAALSSDPPDALIVVNDALTSLNRKRIFDFADERRLPAIYEYEFMARAGGLMSYGPDLTESFERAAALVDRIFKGAKPADLPFEQPTRYRFVLDLKTANAIGLKISSTLLALADEVIE